MSKNAYASSLQNLGGAYRTKETNSASGSGSVANREDRAESVAPAAAVEATPEPVAFEEVVVSDARETGDRPRVKRTKTLGRKPLRPQNLDLDDEEMQDLEDPDGPELVGNHSVKKVAKIMSQIPSSEDWVVLEEAGLHSVMRKCAEHWGHVSFALVQFFTAFFHSFTSIDPDCLQLGKYMFGVVHIAFEDLKKSRAEVKDNDTWIAELELEQKNLKLSEDYEVSRLQNQLKKEKDYAEKESGDLRAELATVEQLAEKDKEEIIAKFKQFAAYDQTIADVGAPEIERCWIVAEKHIKTIPEANWFSFVDKFLNSRDNIEKGLGEPKPYNGPNPSFIPGSPRDTAQSPL